MSLSLTYPAHPHIPPLRRPPYSSTSGRNDPSSRAVPLRSTTAATKLFALRPRRFRLGPEVFIRLLIALVDFRADKSTVDDICEVLLRIVLSLDNIAGVLPSRVPELLGQAPHALRKKLVCLEEVLALGGNMDVGAVLTLALAFTLGHASVTCCIFSTRHMTLKGFAHLPSAPALLPSTTTPLCGVPSTPGSLVIRMLPAFSRATRASLTRARRKRIVCEKSKPMWVKSGHSYSSCASCQLRTFRTSMRPASGLV
jgi:hypothetical protein